MKRLTVLIVGVLALAAALTLHSSTRASTQVTRISGGGTATFDFADGGTIFSVQANLNGNNGVRGQFFCAIPGIVTVAGTDLTHAGVNSDGSVTLRGFAHGFDSAVGHYSGMPFEVRLWPGGPGVGRFIYDDPVVGTPLVDTSVEGDHETVATGHIFFQ